MSTCIHGDHASGARCLECNPTLASVVAEQMSRSHESMMVDRTGWTDEQWCEDADRLMNEPFGAITSLVNGHADRLIKFWREHRGCGGTG